MNDKTFQQAAESVLFNYVLIFVNLFWVFALIWYHWGLSPVVLLAVGLNHALTRIELSQKARQSDAAPKLGKIKLD